MKQKSDCEELNLKHAFLKQMNLLQKLNQCNDNNYFQNGCIYYFVVFD